jgi:pimeloyl-ACP methyl ester carboxylesterase
MTLSPNTTFIDVAGKSTQVTTGGSGPQLLYLHSAAGETDWTGWHDALARHFTVHAPAHPGFAQSEGLDQIDDIYDLAWHYVDLLDALKLSSVPIVGFSLGAWATAELAVLRPERVSQLVLINAAGLHVEGAPIAELFTDDFERLKNLVFFDPKSPAVAEVFPTALDDPRVLMWLRAREATARVGWNPYLHNPKLARHLPRIRARTLVIWGKQDRLIPLAHGKYYSEHIPGARLHVFDNAGHMLPLERPDNVADEVAAFIRG